MADDKFTRPVLRDAQGKKFVKGTRAGPGVPKGLKPKRMKTRIQLAAMGIEPDVAINTILNALLRQAQGGDVNAAELFLKHVQPRPGRRLKIKLPSLKTINDLTD